MSVQTRTTLLKIDFFMIKSLRLFGNSESESSIGHGVGILSRSEVLSGGLSLPANALHQRMVECDRSLPGTFLHATTAVPAFLRVEDDRGFALLGIGYENFHRADIHAPVTSVADLGIEQHGPAGPGQIGNGISFLFELGHGYLPGNGFLKSLPNALYFFRNPL
jgi:hypothetical protein